jgi:carbon monoxide dehydrogenase subunit G
MRVSAEIEIAAPAETVFETVMDTGRLGDWVTTHRGIAEEPGGGLAQGSSFVQKLRVAGLPFEVRWTVTRLERPHRVEWRGEGPGGSAARVDYRLEAGGGATRFEYTNEFELPGGRIAALAGRKIGEARARTEAERSLERLKQLLEG